MDGWMMKKCLMMVGGRMDEGMDRWIDDERMIDDGCRKEDG